MRVMAQMGMVMNLDKCIGCHTCSVTCKQAWTNRAGIEYVWFNNVETRPGPGLSAPLRGPGDVARRLGRSTAGAGCSCKAGGRVKKLLGIFASPVQPKLDGLLRAVDLRLRDPGRRAARRRLPGRPAEVADHRRGHQDHLVGQLGRQPRRRHRDGPPRPDRRAGPARVRGQDPRSSSSRPSCSTCRGSASTASTRRAWPPARPARSTSAPRTASCWSTRTAAAAGGSASPAARTRRSTSTTRPARPRSARSATRGSRSGCRRCARRPASGGCATSGCSSTTPTGHRGRLGRRTSRTCTRRSSTCCSTRTTRPSSRPRARRASPRTGWTRPGAPRSTRWPRPTGWRCRCTRSTARCRWSGTSRRCPRSSTCCASRATTPRTAATCSAPSTRCASRSSTWPSCSPPATPTSSTGVLRRLAAMRAYMRDITLGREPDDVDPRGGRA